MNSDILFNKDGYFFSYRAAGLLIHNDKILLQRTKDDEGYAVPGGHVVLGETADNTLIREFREEIGADIYVDRMVFVGENFFPWGDSPCHQICLYYKVGLSEESQIPLEGAFEAYDELVGIRVDLIFTWIPLSDIEKIEVYPTNIQVDLKSLPVNIKHFIYNQDD